MTDRELDARAVLARFGVAPVFDVIYGNRPRVHIPGFSIATGETFELAFNQAWNLAEIEQERQRGWADRP